MTEQPAMATADNAPPVARTGEDRILPGAVYVLYLVGLPSLGLTSVLGLILAYLMRDTAGPKAQTHYTFQIRTFWMFFGWVLLGAGLFLVGLALSIILVGIPVLMAGFFICAAVSVWIAIRAILGLIYLGRDEAYPRPKTWLV